MGVNVYVYSTCSINFLLAGGFFMWGAMYGKLAVGTVVLNSSLSSSRYTLYVVIARMHNIC